MQMNSGHIRYFYLIRKFRVQLGITMLVFFAGGLILLQSSMLQYSSEASFYMIADRIYNPSSSVVQNDISVTEKNLENKRLEQLVYSNEMIAQLSRSYNLYQHYRIDSTERFAREKLAQKIRDHVALNITSTDFFLLRVTDRNNEIAAAMANSIVKNLDQLNRNYIRSKVSVNLKVYNAFIEQSNIMNEEHSQKIKILLKDLQLLRKGVSAGGMDAVGVEFSLYNAVNKISEITVQNLNSQAYLLNTLKMLEMADSPTVVVVGRALPDTVSRKFMLVLGAFGLAITMTFVIIAFICIVDYYRQELSILFGQDPSKQ